MNVQLWLLKIDRLNIKRVFYPNGKLNLCICMLSIVICLSQAQSYEMYISDAGNFNQPPWQILKYNSEDESTHPFIQDKLSWPQDIMFLKNNVVIISNLSTGKITKYDASSGKYIGDFASGIGGPTRMKVGPDGYIYVLQWKGEGQVLRYTSEGKFIDEFTDVGVQNSIGLDWDNEENLYVSSYRGDYIRKYDQSGKNLGKFISENIVGPTNIWFSDSGELMVVDYDDGSVKRFDADGSYLGVFIEGLKNSEGIATDMNDHLFIGDGGTHSVKMFKANGEFIRDVILPKTTNLLTPNAVVIKY